MPAFSLLTAAVEYRKATAHLFVPFFTTKGEHGTGLGLWVTQGILQKQGGSIAVKTSVIPGRSWTVFSVFVPSITTYSRSAEAAELLLEKLEAYSRRTTQVDAVGGKL